MKKLEGRVIGKKMAKTATVLLERQKVSPLYEKRIKVGKKYQVHDELGVKVGDWVKIKETRPFSKLKKWQTVEVIKK